MPTNTPTTFEERFKAFVPEEMRVLSKGNDIDIVHQHDDAGILVKSIAYFIDLGVSVLLLPIIYNVYHYLKRGQTLGQQIMGIRIYHFHTHGKPSIASI
jgi:RDD family